MTADTFEDTELRSQLSWLSTGLIFMCLGILFLIGSVMASAYAFIGSGVGLILTGLCMYAYAFLQATGNSPTTTTVPSFFSPSQPDYPSPRNEHDDTLHRFEDIEQSESDIDDYDFDPTQSD